MTTFPQGPPLKIHPHVACDWTAFFSKAGWYFHCMYVSNILYPFTYGLRLGYLHLLAMANNPAIYMQLCNYLFQILFSTLLGTHTRSGPAVSHGNSIFNTLRNCHTDLESVAQLHSSIESTQGFWSPHRLRNTCRVLLGLKIYLFVFY